MLEQVAIAIYWAAYEMYPPNNNPAYGPVNPVSRMTKEQAWKKATDEQRGLCLFQAQRAMETINEASN